MEETTQATETITTNTEVKRKRGRPFGWRKVKTTTTEIIDGTQSA